MQIEDISRLPIDLPLAKCLTEKGLSDFSEL